MKEFGVRIIVEGTCRGEPVVVGHKLSFFGEVNAEKGVLVESGVSIAGKPLIIPGTRGSTVGSYVLYALSEYGKAPSCIIVGKAEPILIIGCVLARVPLAVVKDFRSLYEHLTRSKRPYVELDPVEGVLRVYEQGVLYSDRGS